MRLRMSGGELVQPSKLALPSELGLDECVLWKRRQKEHLIESIFHNFDWGYFS